MSEFADNLAYWVPTAILGLLLVWCVAKLLGRSGVGAGATSHRYDVGAWPFVLVLLGGALFGLLAAISEFVFGDNPWIRIPVFVAGGVITVRLLPRLWEYIVSPASPRGQQSDSSAHSDE